MKKILVIEPSGKLYGSEMVLWDIIRNQQSKDFEYVVALPPHSPFSNELDKINIKSIGLLDIHRGIVYKVISYIKLIFYLLKNKTDLIFINQAGILRPIATITKVIRKPIVCEVSTLEDGLWMNKLAPTNFKQVKTFICNSQYIADKLIVPIEKKSILYYGYHWKNIHPVERESIQPFHIVLLGRISESKGHFLLVKAMNELKKRGVLNLKIFFVGDAPTKEIDNRIRTKISKAQLEDYFIFRGFQQDIEKELSDKNLMVIPSLKEPFGRIFCEAAEANIPVVVADSGGLGELSKKFELGLRFEGNNAIDLATKIEYAIQNYDIVRKEFKENSKKMLDLMKMETYISIIEKINADAIENKNSSCVWMGMHNN